MTVLRRVLLAGGVLAGVAGAYFVGATLNRPVRSEPEVRAQAPESVTEINGLKIPDALAPAKPDAAAGAIKQPADVLTGVKPVPEDVLRAPPSSAPKPGFVIPDLPKLPARMAKSEPLTAPSPFTSPGSPPPPW